MAPDTQPYQKKAQKSKQTPPLQTRVEVVNARKGWKGYVPRPLLIIMIIIIAQEAKQTNKQKKNKINK